MKTNQKFWSERTSATRKFARGRLSLAVLLALTTSAAALTQAQAATSQVQRRFHLAPPTAVADSVPMHSREVTTQDSSVPIDPWEAANGTSPYTLNIADQAKADLLAKRMAAHMTLDEKVAYLGSDHFAAQSQFKLPALNTAEGVDGVGATVEPSVVYPAAVSLAASWDAKLAAERGRELALDAQAGGVQLVNGPGLNMYRTPYGGREAEFLTGEDPILGAVLGTAYVEGQQSQGVMAELKHMVGNDQESNRTAINETIDQRTLHEIYQLPFEAVVKIAQPAAIMCAFTAINGTHSCQDEAFSRGVIENQWGFDGFFQSDWGAIYDVPAAVKADTSIDASGGADYSSSAIQAALDAGTITEADIDRLVYRVIRQVLYFKMGANVGTPDTRTEPDRAEGAALATKAAEQGMVLLRNQNHNLPLTASVKKIAVLGAFADQPPARPTGSGWVPYRHYVSELAGLKAAAPAGTQVDYFPINSQDPANTVTDSGWKAYYFSSPEWQGSPSVMRTESSINFDWSSDAEPGCSSGACGSAVWTAKITPKFSSDYVFKVHGNGQMQVVVNGKTIVQTNSTATTGANGLGFHQAGYGKMALQAGQTYDVEVTYSYESQWVNYLGGIVGAQFSYAALKPAPELKNYDEVIVSGGMGGQYEGEGTDHGFSLPEYQSELIKNVAEVNKHTTAVMYDTSAMDMTAFNDKLASLIYAWYPGQNGGTALADILFGKVSPSGKLPITLDKSDSDSLAAQNFPKPINYDEINGTLQLDYQEGPYFGYREYDRIGASPLYPFGYGLSYTNFSYSNVRLGHSIIDGEPSLDVSFDVTNTGKMDGAEIAQVYVGALAPKVDRPVRELKGFEKEFIKAGDTKHYTVHLPQRAFAYYNSGKNVWNVDAGAYDIAVGASSKDLKLHTTYTAPISVQLSPKSSLPIFDPGFAH